MHQKHYTKIKIKYKRNARYKYVRVSSCIMQQARCLYK